MTWSYSSIHGDVIATTTQTPTSYQLFSWTPFGSPGATMPDTTAANTIDYGWLGTHARPTDTALTVPLVLMGARTYHPGLGRFLQTDPIEGGSANDYDYVAGDPINSLDLDGRCASCVWDTLINPIETFKTGYWGMSPTGQAAVEATVKGALGGLSVAVPVAAVGRAGWAAKIALHSDLHRFPKLGGRLLPHIQLNIWRHGKTGSGIAKRLPLPRRWFR